MQCHFQFTTYAVELTVSTVHFPTTAATIRYNVLQEIPHDFHKQIKVKLIKYARKDKRVISCKLHVVECKESGKYTCG